MNTKTKATATGATVARTKLFTQSRNNLSTAPLADKLLSRLDKVKATGPYRWIACCPAHEDRSPSLTIRELEDGRVLIHCFSGCSASDVMAAIGLSLSDLFPERPSNNQRYPRERRPFHIADILKCVTFEVLVAATMAARQAQGETLSEEERQRLYLASNRLRNAAKIAGVDHA